MSEGLPKSARDLLARQTAADAHPSPDLLNGYVEQSLTAAEKSRVASHLALCEECREVVFLASGAVEVEEQVPVPLAATPQRFHNVPAGSAAMAGGDVPAETAAAKPKRMWWKWAAPAVAAVVIVAGVVIEHDRIVGIFRPASPQMADMSRQTPAPPAPAQPTAPMIAESQQHPEAALNIPAVESKSSPQKAYKALQSLPAEQQTQVVKKAEAQQEAKLQAQIPAAMVSPKPQSAGALGAASPAQVQPGTAAQPSNVAAAPPPVTADTLSSAMAKAAQQREFLKSGFSGAGQAGSATSTLELSEARRAMAGRMRWRISSAGHLEHSASAGTWTRVLASEPVTFRVVSTVGNNVWAGGNDGALFHSTDAGEHWNKAALGEHGAITFIHFDTAQQGSIVTDSGATWTTSDGGQTWSKQ